MSLPAEGRSTQAMLEWGWNDDAVALPGWAKPAVKCDPAFANIRAGMNGVPIQYRFPMDSPGDKKVVLGFCESHWSTTGMRPVVCQVEGTPRLTVDPIARWGRHKPGAVEFKAKDANKDGWLDVSVLPKEGAQDLNPILNVIWMFKPDQELDLAAVVSGSMNAQALHYVDVGGKNDQSLYGAGTLEYNLTVPASGLQLEFLVAAPGGSVPKPAETGWTVAGLRKAAADVWRDWKE